MWQPQETIAELLPVESSRQPCGNLTPRLMAPALPLHTSQAWSLFTLQQTDEPTMLPVFMPFAKQSWITAFLNLNGTTPIPTRKIMV